MRILIPFVGDSFGGSHRSIIELMKGLRRRGIDAFIVVHQPYGPLASVLDDERIPYQHFPANRLAGESPNRLSIFLGVIRHFRRIRNYVKANAVDVVHGNDLRINLTWSLPSRISGAKFVWHQRTVLSSSRYWRLIAHLCDHFVAISQYVFDSVPRNIPARKKSLVANPFDTHCQYDRKMSRQWLIDRYQVPRNSLLLGYLGRLVAYKNIPLVLQGVADLVDTVGMQCRMHLVVAGTGDSSYIEYLYDIVESLEITNSVTFTGFAETPGRVLAGLDIAVSPSPRDAFGRTVVEAMVQQTPVMAARAGGHEEIIQDDVDGILYEPESVEDFVRRIVPLIREPPMRERLAASAYDKAVRRYGAERHVDAMIAIYNGKRES